MFKFTTPPVTRALTLFRQVGDLTRDMEAAPAILDDDGEIKKPAVLPSTGTQTELRRLIQGFSKRDFRRYLLRTGVNL